MSVFAVSVPAAVSAAVSSASAVGFSGSRSPSGTSVAAVRAAAAAVSAPVLVGCAKGVDEVARELFPNARVFSVSSGLFGSGRSAFARRSAAFVRALSSAGGVLLSFPSSPCPAGLLPSRSWSSACGGSGTWGTLALAVGLGVPCFVFLGSVPAPAGWGFSPCGGGWFSFSPAGVQLSLF